MHLRRAVVITLVTLAVALGLRGPIGVRHGQAAGAPSLSVLLELPYGDGPGQVGVLEKGALHPGSLAVFPAMCQMTGDGSIWVLDTVNARVLEFRDGKQVSYISTASFHKRPHYFGVTRSALFLAKQGRRDDMPAGFLWRYDRADQTCRVVNLDLPDGRRFSPMKVTPLGSAGTQLLIWGGTYPDLKDAAVAIDEEGSISLVSEREHGPTPFMAAADGTIWQMIPAREHQGESAAVLVEQWQPVDGRWPVLIKQWQPAKGSWTSVCSTSLPARQLPAAEAAHVGLTPLGVDEQQRITVALYEGRPSSLRFIRLSPSGEILAAVGLQDFGFVDPLAVHQPGPVQLLPDGSILAQYATPERYQILRISFRTRLLRQGAPQACANAQARLELQSPPLPS
jgi:hypothetical protein